MSTITIDTGRLPTWHVLQAMNTVYNEAVVRLQNALSLDELMALPEFKYRFYVRNGITGENRAVVEKGEMHSLDPALLPWEVAISILALIRPMGYTATYGVSNVVTVYFSFEGDDKRKSDMDRFWLLFEERPEFNLWKLSEDIPLDDVDIIGKGVDGGKKA